MAVLTSWSAFEAELVMCHAESQVTREAPWQCRTPPLGVVVRVGLGMRVRSLAKTDHPRLLQCCQKGDAFLPAFCWTDASNRSIPRHGMRALGRYRARLDSVREGITLEPFARNVVDRRSAVLGKTGRVGSCWNGLRVRALDSADQEV